jgi:hypothetical protein
MFDNLDLTINKYGNYLLPRREGASSQEQEKYIIDLFRGMPLL